MQKPISKKQSSNDQYKKHSPPPQFSSYKSKLNYSVNLSIVPPTQISSSSKNTSKTRHRYSTRSSSILLKSNSLALSDSESTLSDDTKIVGENSNFFK